MLLGKHLGLKTLLIDLLSSFITNNHLIGKLSDSSCLFSQEKTTLPYVQFEIVYCSNMFNVWILFLTLYTCGAHGQNQDPPPYGLLVNLNQSGSNNVFSLKVPVPENNFNTAEVDEVAPIAPVLGFGFGIYKPGVCNLNVS